MSRVYRFAGNRRRCSFYNPYVRVESLGEFIPRFYFSFVILHIMFLFFDHTPALINELGEFLFFKLRIVGASFFLSAMAQMHTQIARIGTAAHCLARAQAYDWK